MATISPLQLRRSVSMPVNAVPMVRSAFRPLEQDPRPEGHESSIPSPAAASAAALASSSDSRSQSPFLELFPLDSYPSEDAAQHRMLSSAEEKEYVPFQLDSAPLSPKHTAWDFDSLQVQQLHTPLQPKRAGSLSIDTHISAHQTGLYTPQSSSNAPWTTPLRGFNLSDTPLATPLATPSEVLESPFEMAHSPDAAGGAALHPPAHTAQPAESGVNPFYCPPACMRIDEGLEIPWVRKKRVTPPMMPSRSRSASIVSTTSMNSDRERDPVLKPFKCDECQKCFRRAEHLRRHCKVHTQERPFTCPIQGCGRKFSRSDNLKAHTLTHAKKEGRNVYVEGLEKQIGLVPSVKRRKSKEVAAPEAAAV